MMVLRTNGTYCDPGKLGGVKFSQCYIISEYAITGMVSIRDSQNLSLNIATE